MAQALPARPNLQFLKKLAKKRLRSMRGDGSPRKLADAQLAVAREHGFASWRKLKAHVEAQTHTAPSPALADLIGAIVAHDADAVTQILKSSPALANTAGPHPHWGGRPTPLQVAVEHGDLNVVRALLDAGADPSNAGEQYDGWTPLMLALNWKNPSLAKELLQHGAKVRLVEALMLRDDKRVEKLLRDDPHALHQPMPNDATPLHFARTAKAVRLLLDAGVAPDARDKHDKTPAEALAFVGVDKSVVRLLIERTDSVKPWVLAAIGAQSSLRMAARKDPSILRDPAVIAAAITSGHVDVVKWLLAQGADPNALTGHGSTLLHLAAWAGHLEIAKLLVSRGADPNALDDEHKTTPHVHARRALDVHGRQQCAAVAEFLEGATAKPRAVKNSQWKPIMDAAFLGDAAKLRKLLQAGADANVVSATAHRYRPLHRAIEPKKLRKRDAAHEEVVKTLLDAGADPKLRGTFSNLTALQLAATGEFRFLPLLRKYFEPLDIFHAAACADDTRVAELLKHDRMLAVASDVNGLTPLHYCCASSAHKLGKPQSDALVRITKMLLKAGADPAATFLFDGQWPITPLYYACGQQNNVAVAKVLLDAGASPFDGESIYHSADENHCESLALLEQYAPKTPLAVECTKAMCNLLHWNRSRGVPWLLAHGADPNYLHPKHGDSALHAAVKRRASDDVIRLLLAHGGDPKRKNRDGLSAIQLARGSESRLPNRPCPTGRDARERSPAKSKAAARMLALLQTKPKGGRR